MANPLNDYELNNVRKGYFGLFVGMSDLAQRMLATIAERDKQIRKFREFRRDDHKKFMKVVEERNEYRDLHARLYLQTYGVPYDG